MKKIILAIVLTTALPAGLFASADIPDYGSAGQIEINGIVSVHTSHYSDYKSVYSSIRGGINYYIIENFHLGLQPLLGFLYSKYYFDFGSFTSTSSSYSLTPGLSFQFGYLFPLWENIYFDLSSDIEMFYQFSFSSDVSNEHLYVFSPGVVTAIKFKIDRILINLSFSHKFVKYASGDGFNSSTGSVNKGWEHSFYELSTGIGISYIL